MRPGLTFQPQITPGLIRTLEQLPVQAQRRFQRRAIRQAMTVFQRIAKPLYRAHRTDIPRKHLDQSLAIKTRSYKSPTNPKVGVVWGVLGFRLGRVKGRELVNDTKRYSHEWAGWRAHFFERGFRHSRSGRTVAGRRYLELAYKVGQVKAQQVFRMSMRRLIRSNGKNAFRMPRNFLRREIAIGRALR